MVSTLSAPAALPLLFSLPFVCLVRPDRSEATITTFMIHASELLPCTLSTSHASPRNPRKSPTSEAGCSQLVPNFRRENPDSGIQHYAIEKSAVL